jgi:hypothetical protein
MSSDVSSVGLDKQMNKSQMSETKYYSAGKFMKPKKKRCNSVRSGRERDERER